MCEQLIPTLTQHHNLNSWTRWTVDDILYIIDNNLHDTLDLLNKQNQHIQFIMEILKKNKALIASTTQSKKKTTHCHTTYIENQPKPSQ